MSFGNLNQLQEYKKLKNFIDKNLKKNIKIETIEKESFYSYRNINRIFQSLNHETTGRYRKRIRIEKAAEYLKYSDYQVSDIAIEVGFSDVAAFSKSFKKRFKCSPLAYRQNVQIEKETNSQNVLSFEVETLPEFELLYLEHLGDIENIVAIEKTWNILIKYCTRHELISKKIIFFSEILDDNEITDSSNCRTNVAVILDKPLSFVHEGLFQVKTHQPQKYVKFIHKGPNDMLVETYNLIYSSWTANVQLEFADKPTLEFYVNHHTNVHKKKLITEIYIPIE